MIQLLNARFVNTWVLNKTLGARKEDAKNPAARQLAQAVLKSRKPGSPVDSFVFAPDLQMIARQPANDLLAEFSLRVPRYRAFLTGALELRREPGGRSPGG